MNPNWNEARYQAHQNGWLPSKKVLGRIPRPGQEHINHLKAAGHALKILPGRREQGQFFKHSFLAQNIDVLTQWQPSLIFHHSWVNTCKLEQHKCAAPDFTARQHTLPGNQLKTDIGDSWVTQSWKEVHVLCFYSIWYLTAKIEALCSPEPEHWT